MCLLVDDKDAVVVFNCEVLYFNEAGVVSKEESRKHVLTKFRIFLDEVNVGASESLIELTNVLFEFTFAKELNNLE